MARYPQQYLEVPQIAVAVLAINTIGYLPITSKGNKWSLTAICLHTSYVFTVLMKEKSAEYIIQVYLSGILAPEGRGVALHSDSRTEFKNKIPVKHVAK